MLFEVAFDSFSTTRRSETSIPIASVEAPGELGYLWNKPAGVTSNGSGFVTGGHAYGPQGPMSPVESSEMYLAQLDSRWNGSHFVPTDARGVIDPPISLLYS